MTKLKAVISVAAALVLATVLPGPPAALAQAAPPDRIFVANSGSDTVSVIDASTNAVIATVAVGDRPIGVAASPFEGRVYVTNEMSGTVSVIDAATLAAVATVPVGVRPVGVAVSPLGGEVWVANAGSHTVSVISTTTDAVVATVPAGVAPHGVAFSPDGRRAYVTTQADTVSVVDTAAKTVIATVPVGHSPFGIAVAGGKVYVTNSSSRTVSVIDDATNGEVTEVPVGIDPIGIVANRTGDYVYVANQSSGTISVIRVATDTQIETVPAARPHGLAFSTDGTRLYATGTTAVGGVVTVVGTGVTVPVGDFPAGVAVVALRPPVVSGQSWFSTGAKSRIGPAGSGVAVYAVGAMPGLPYQLVLSRMPGCADVVAVLNAATVTPGANGLIGTVRATISAGTPAGTYSVCFRHTAGNTATGVVTFTVS